MKTRTNTTETAVLAAPAAAATAPARDYEAVYRATENAYNRAKATCAATARELSTACAKIAVATENDDHSLPTLSAMMDIHMAVGMLKSEWGQYRVLGRILGYSTEPAIPEPEMPA